MTQDDPDSDRTLYLSFQIPAVFSTPDERHQYGDMMANYLKSALRIMGTRTTVMYEIVKPTGEREGPDDAPRTRSRASVTGRNAI